MSLKNNRKVRKKFKIKLFLIDWYACQSRQGGLK